MDSLASTRLYWLVQPLMDAGLELAEIQVLVFRLGFDALVRSDQGGPSDPMAPVGDQPMEVRVAWMEMIDRMVRVADRG